MTLDSPEAQTVPQGFEISQDTPEVTDSLEASQEPVQAVPDPVEALRAELVQEYTERLAHAELRIQAAEAGVTIPEAFLNVLDLPKLIDSDGNPNTEAIASIVGSVNKEPQYRQDIGLGRQGSAYHTRQVSLDARRR
ncbi:hypothetical protein [Streptomyces hundungensis]|uniref:hypothetical protein n=1 Tax=Streptomyces hundungensis TaxID=1077946 RepID=UPI0033F82FD6